MSISIGGIDLTTAIINLEYQMIRTQQLLEWLQRNNPGMRWPDTQAIQAADATAFQQLKSKYPEAGIDKK
jgi:hypothetical protein